MPVEESSSAWRERKSLYRLETVQVRMGVETGSRQLLARGDFYCRMAAMEMEWRSDVRRTLDGVCCVWFGLRDDLGGGDGDVLDVGHGGNQGRQEY